MCMSIYFMSYVYEHIFYIVRLFHGSRGGDLRACTYILYCWAFFMACVAVGCMCMYAYIICMYMFMYRAVYVTAKPSTKAGWHGTCMPLEPLFIYIYIYIYIYILLDISPTLLRSYALTTLVYICM